MILNSFLTKENIISPSQLGDTQREKNKRIIKNIHTQGCIERPHNVNPNLAKNEKCGTSCFLKIFLLGPQMIERLKSVVATGTKTNEPG